MTSSSLAKLSLAALTLACVATGFTQSDKIAQSDPATSNTKLDTSIVFARGDYGLASDTDVFIALVTPTYESGNWRVQASLPYVHLSGPATVVGNTGAPTVSRTVSGLGDASLTITRKLDPEPHGWSTSIGTKFKFPTADDAKGLGTGEMDYAIQADVIKTGGPVIPFATIGYQYLGRNASYPMKSGVFATAGFATVVSTGNTLGLATNWRQRTIRDGKAAFEAMLFAQHALNQRSHIQVFVMRGFTDASPDYTVGLTLGLKF